MVCADAAILETETSVVKRILKIRDWIEEYGAHSSCKKLFWHKEIKLPMHQANIEEGRCNR